MAMETGRAIQLQGPLEIENVQIPFEDDELFFSTNKEVARVIDVTSTISDLNTEVVSEKLYIKGTQKIDIIFQEDLEQAVYSQATAEKMFEGYVDIWSDCVQPIDVEASVTHCHVYLNEMGKLAGNGGVNLKIKKISQQEIPQTELLSDSIQAKQKSITSIKQTPKDTKHFMIREGVELSEEIAPIGTIIKSSMTADLQHFSINGEKLYVEGDLCLKVLYEPQESEGGALEYYVDEHIPFNTLVKHENGELDQEGLLVKLGDAVYSVEARPDFRGENRFIQFQIDINLEIIEECKENHTVIEDLYDLNDPKLNVNVDSVSYISDKKMLKTTSECVDTIIIEDTTASVARVLDVSVSLGIIRVEPGKEYCAKQCGCINILYIDETGCIQVIQKETTWDIISEECADANLYNVFYACTKKVDCRVSQSNELQISFILEHEVEAYYFETCAVVMEAFEEEYEMPKAGLYVCFNNQNDIWEIAKKFRVKESDVHIVESEMEEQKRVIVSKKMY